MANRQTEGRLRFYHLKTELSAIPSELYPPDPAVVKALREVDPRVVPLTVRKVYRTQAGTILVRTYHAIGIHEDIPSGPVQAELDAVLMPSTPSRPKLLRPTRVPFHLWDPGIRSMTEPGPGKWLPFDWRWYHALASVQNDVTMAEANEMQESKLGRYGAARAAKDAALDQARYEEVADQKHIAKHAAAFDVNDWRNVERGVLKPPAEPAPFIDLGARGSA